MDSRAIQQKFGDNYVADDNTFIMGIDQRFTREMARRFKDRIVLESCTGAGFTTIALAREAAHVYTVEIEPAHLSMAKTNVGVAGLQSKVTFTDGNVLDRTVVESRVKFDAAFLDPDWAISGADHVFKFRRSNTRPPADELLQRIFELTPNIALVLPPLVPLAELDGLPEHERQSFYMADSHELYCLFFGELIEVSGASEFRV